MKTLFLIRHAKSSREDASLPDRDRPLDVRGKRDAPNMGKRLAKRIAGQRKTSSLAVLMAAAFVHRD